MTTWSKVRWSQATQVLDLLETPAEERMEGAEGPPDRYFAALRAAERRADAADFIGQALPRMEAVAWAARTVRDSVPPGAAADPRTRALRAALFWVQDPTDARRYAAFEAADACDAGPEALAALAAFFSGGSLSPAGNPPVPPPNYACGRCAAGAVKLATIAADRTGAALDAALDAGEAIARAGLKAGA